MSDHLDTENAGSVLEFSARAGICKPLPMQISEIERKLYAVRREWGDICISSLAHLGALYTVAQLLLQKYDDNGANHDQ